MDGSVPLSSLSKNRRKYFLLELAETETAIKKLVLTTDNSNSFKDSAGISIWLPTYSSSDKSDMM